MAIRLSSEAEPHDSGTTSLVNLLVRAGAVDRHAGATDTIDTLDATDHERADHHDYARSSAMRQRSRGTVEVRQRSR